VGWPPAASATSGDRGQGLLASGYPPGVPSPAIAFTCPERRDQIARRKAKGPAGGRPPAFDQDIYKKRNVVERCFGRLKQFRGLATRYAKRVAYYRAEVVIATIAFWLCHDSQDRP
jgi:transposase